VAISGDTVVVGASGEDSSSTGVNSTPNESASQAGAAYVFTRGGGVWTQQAYLKPGAILNRNAEYGGWLFIRNALTTGAVQYTDLVHNFLESAEFKLSNPSLTNRQFAALMYRQILLREGTSAELDFMESALAGGLSRVQFATNFLQSTEFRLGTGPRLTTFVLYACLLLRDAMNTEFTNAVTRLSPPANTPVTTLISEILASSEFAGLFL